MHPDDEFIQVPGRAPDPMTGIDGNADPPSRASSPPQDAPTQELSSAGFPSTRFTIRIPSAPMTYAAALKRSADQARGESPEDPEDDHDDGVVGTDPVANDGRGPWRSWPGPVAGFTTNRLFENLDPVVRKEWETLAAQGAIFAHYLNGGYTPTIARNANVISDDLKGSSWILSRNEEAGSRARIDIYKTNFHGEGEINPTVIHPTAVTPELHNRYASPFIFLVTDIPDRFRDWLIFAGVKPVSSHLGVLFFEKGMPTPHDYVMFLTNYNMRTETDELKEQAIATVRESVINLLFDVPSNTSGRVTAFIRLHHDNLRDGVSEDQARNAVKDSVRVTMIEVIVPGTRTKIPIYGVYIHPPTAIPDLLKRWRQWVEGQRYYTTRNGVGVKYQFSFKCIHCKSTDHPGGLCYWKDVLRAEEGKRTDDPDPVEEILPVEELLSLGPSHPQAGPSNQHGGSGVRGGRQGSVPVRGRATPGSSRLSAARGAGLKKRRFN
jgi:hypothetical protein